VRRHGQEIVAGVGRQRAVHRLRRRRYRDDGQELAPAEAGGAIASKYRNAGQTCVCANRILVQDGVYDAFTKRLAETAGAMKVADGFEPGAMIGPLILSLLTTGIPCSTSSSPGRAMPRPANSLTR